MTRRWLLTPSSSVSVSYPDGWVASDPLSGDTPSSTISAGACITSWPLEIRRLPSGTCRFPKRKVHHLFSRHGNLCPHLNAPQSIAVQLVRPFNLNSRTAVTLDRINCRIIWRAPTLKNDPVR